MRGVGISRDDAVLGVGAVLHLAWVEVVRHVARMLLPFELR